MRKLKALLAATALATVTAALPANAADTRIAMVVKALGNGFFDAAHEGGDEAAKELGNVELIYTGPTTPTAEAQIEVINSLISQKVDAIVDLGQRHRTRWCRSPRRRCSAASGDLVRLAASRRTAARCSSTRRTPT